MATDDRLRWDASEPRRPLPAKLALLDVIADVPPGAGVPAAMLLELLSIPTAMLWRRLEGRDSDDVDVDMLTTSQLWSASAGAIGPKYRTIYIRSSQMCLLRRKSKCNGTFIVVVLVIKHCEKSWRVKDTCWQNQLQRTHYMSRDGVTDCDKLIQQQRQQQQRIDSVTYVAAADINRRWVDRICRLHLRYCGITVDSRIFLLFRKRNRNDSLNVQSADFIDSENYFAQLLFVDSHSSRWSVKCQLAWYLQTVGYYSL